MKKIGFVIPWYGDTIPGGAEADMRNLAKNMVKRGMEVEVLSTCVREFTADWNENYHAPGLTEEGGLKIRRFPCERSCIYEYGEVNMKLMNGIRRLSDKNEYIYVNGSVNSPKLCAYMKEHKDEYRVFLLIPYLFGLTYHAAAAAPEKTILMPCFHDEAYAYMRCFRRQYSAIAGMTFHARPEMELAARLYDLRHMHTAVLGGGMDVDLTFDADRFRRKYNIKEDFIIYAGRKDVGKNIYTLIRHFIRYRKERGSNLKLLLLGGGDVCIPAEAQDYILDLGFVPVQDKYDACAAALLLCQPSKNESFSIVIMESWLCERPVIVFEECAVTKNFAIESNGGLYFKDYADFAGAVDYIRDHPEKAKQMALNGKQYVKEHFAWDVVVDGYRKIIGQISPEE